MIYVKPKKIRVDDEKLPKAITEMPFVKDLTPRHGALRAKFALIFFLGFSAIATITTAGIQSVLSFQRWHDNWYFAEHNILEVKDESGYKNKAVKFTFSLPVTVEKREKVVVRGYGTISGTSSPQTIKVLTQEEKERVVAYSGLSKIVRGVWILETGKGTNTNESAHHNECTSVGMTNEFGYRALDDYCFETFEDSVSRVTEWFEAELKTKSLNNALCYYSMGKNISTCEYAISFAKLDVDGKLASN